MQIQVNKKHTDAKLEGIEFNIIKLINNVSEFQSMCPSHEILVK